MHQVSKVNVGYQLCEEDAPASLCSSCIVRPLPTQYWTCLYNVAMSKRHTEPAYPHWNWIGTTRPSWNVMAVEFAQVQPPSLTVLKVEGQAPEEVEEQGPSSVFRMTDAHQGLQSWYNYFSPTSGTESNAKPIDPITVFNHANTRAKGFEMTSVVQSFAAFENRRT